MSSDFGSSWGAQLAGDMGEPWHLVSSLQPKVILSPRALLAQTAVINYYKFLRCTRCPVILKELGVPWVHNSAGDLGEPWH